MSLVGKKAAFEASFSLCVFFFLLHVFLFHVLGRLLQQLRGRYDLFLEGRGFVDC
jgi:hypothetical protein